MLQSQRNEPAATPPEEDRLEPPAAWTERLLPWRGKRPGREVRLDPQAPEALRDLIRRHEADLNEALAIPENADHAEAARAYLRGEPDARGAAAVVGLLRHSPLWGSGSRLRPGLDAWLLDHGLPFAVCASIESLALVTERHRDGSRRRRDLRTRLLEPLVLGMIYTINREVETGVAALRSLLAAASDEEYAAVVAAAAAHRDTPAKRVVAMLLLPGEREWSREACLAYAPVRAHGLGDPIVLHSVDGAAQLAAAGISHIDDYRVDTATVAALVGGAGVESLPVLTESLRRPLNAAERRLLLGAVAMLPDDRAVRYLLDHLAEPHVFQAAVDAAARFPVRTLRSIAEAGAGAELDHRRRLSAVANANPAVAAAARSRLSEDERRAVDELLADLHEVEAAAPDELPPLLVAPPWRRRRPKIPAVVLTGLTASEPARLDWAPGERERWAPRGREHPPVHRRENWRIIAERAEELDDGRKRAAVLANAPMAIAAPLAERSIGPIRPYTVEDLQAILARFDAAAADPAVRFLADNPAFHEALPPIVSPAAARLAADWLTRLKTARPSAAAWFDRHGPEGARLLVPDALGSDRPRRRAAEAALAHVAVRHGVEAVRAAAAHHGGAARDAVETLLGADPLEPPQGVKIPKPPAWAGPAVLPQVLLEGRGKALPPESVVHLTTVLALATPEFPYAGLDVVADACDRDSLREFSWALFEQWLLVGAPSKDGWALTQLAHFADDETVRRLAPLVREWPGRRQHRRAVAGLDVLGAIGSEEALRAVHDISQKVKFKALKEKAREQIESIAAGLGLSTEQLADRLVPDFGLDEEGTLVLDYGPRRFRVGFDGQLRPFVTDSDGRPRKSLPRPGAGDDAALAEPAHRRFTRLKKELRAVAAEQVRRLERAMVESRSWTPEEFRECFVGHPLMRHLARRLVWSAETDDERTAFRLAEDRSLADVEENEIELPDDAMVRLAHPARLGGEAVAAWAEILADYEILQPFPQLSRPVMAFTEEELATGRLERFEGAEVEIGRIFGLLRRGWHRAAPQDGGVEPGIAYRLPGGGFVVVALDPGIVAGYVEERPRQRLRSVRLASAEDYGGRTGGHPRRVDPVAASEALASLAGITGTG